MHPEISTFQTARAVQERRKHRRVRTSIPCELMVKGYTSSIRIQTSDLSPGGCYIEMMFTLPVGTPLDLKLWVNEVRIDCGAVVATCDPQVGNGIKFLAISPQDEARIQAFVHNLF
jgi:c-di-GMP-binding flagellar brake protein YcgR